MTKPDNNSLPLEDPNIAMPTSKATFLTIDEILKNYPSVKARGWSSMDFEQWIGQDLITGRMSESDPKVIEIEKSSFEAFMSYHNAHLKRRVDDTASEALKVKLQEDKTASRRKPQ